jgi:hypothetical protein
VSAGCGGELGRTADRLPRHQSRLARQPLPDNPLRAAGSLGVANAIEYAAQAMAVHGALLGGSDGAPQAGYLTSVRSQSGGAGILVVNNAGIHDDAVFPGMKAGAVAPGDRRLAARLLPRHPAADPAHAAHPLGPHHQHLVGGRAGRQPRPGQLRRGQGRAQQRHQGAGAGTGQPRRHRQRHRAGHHRFADGGFGFRCRDHQAPGAGAACRQARGGGGAGRLPGQFVGFANELGWAVPALRP